MPVGVIVEVSTKVPLPSDELIAVVFILDPTVKFPTLFVDATPSKFTLIPGVPVDMKKNCLLVCLVSNISYGAA
jgi:hypothetical protein